MFCCGLDLLIVKLYSCIGCDEDEQKDNYNPYNHSIAFLSELHFRNNTRTNIPIINRIGFETNEEIVPMLKRARTATRENTTNLPVMLNPIVHFLVMTAIAIISRATTTIQPTVELSARGSSKASLTVLPILLVKPPIPVGDSDSSTQNP